LSSQEEEEEEENWRWRRGNEIANQIALDNQRSKEKVSYGGCIAFLMDAMTLSCAWYWICQKREHITSVRGIHVKVSPLVTL
jgi:hypothetical protein